MQRVEPQVRLVARPQMDYEVITEYLKEVGGLAWLERFDQGELDAHLNDPQNLAEFAGRLCYRSWEPGLNPNVTRVRKDQEQYLGNLLGSLHGSVLEHVSFSFVLHNVSRVCCYDSDTEVLTDQGWVPWPKIEGDETFATLNPHSGELEYQRATEVYHADYDGPMYRVASEQVDLLVTPNHRMWVRKYDTRAARRGEQDFGAEFAEDILHKRVQYQKAAVWHGYTPERVEIPATTRTYVRKDTGTETTRRYPGISLPTEAFARFLGYFIAEGCIDGHQIVLAQNRGPTLEKMSRTIEEMGLPSYLPEAGDGTVRTQSTALRDFLSELGHSHEKYVPGMVHGWEPETIAVFLDAMVEGDGTVHKKYGHRVIYTGSRELADDLQVLAIKAGISANVRLDDRVGLERVMPDGQRFNNLRPYYMVSLLGHRSYPLVNTGRTGPSRYWNSQGHNDQMEQYSGRIHCVKVPNGLLWVRRNGKPVVSGNTHELIRHRPGVAVSQESLRFVRLSDLPFWFPDWAEDDPELMERATEMLQKMEEFQFWMAEHFGLDDEGVKFAEKKHKTSFMRRFAPEGVATGLVWTANVRTLRHAIEARTAPGAEEEIRKVFQLIGETLKEEAPAFFGDYTVEDGAWVPQWRKV